MKISGNAHSVWPGYVAAVASLLLGLLLLAGVLVVAISQLGRVVGSYDRQILVEIIDDERRAEALEQLDKKSRALAEVATSRMAPVKAPVKAPLKVAEAPGAKELAQEKDLNDEIQQKQTALSLAQAELARLDARPAPVVQVLVPPPAPVKEPVRVAEKVFRFTFGAGVQNVEERVIRELRASLSREDLSQRTWLLEAGSKGVSAVSSREVFRLMVGLRTQLLDLGLPGDRVRVVLNPERSPLDLGGTLRPGDLMFVLRPDNQTRVPS